jgi:hypothetical protein
MAYHDTTCVCGNKKPTDTLLCDECRQAADQTTWTIYTQSERFSNAIRRSAAIRLLSAARRRNRT